MGQSRSPTNDRLSRLLAAYLEETEVLGEDAVRLHALRERYLAAHPDLAADLQSHFQHEDALAADLGGKRVVLPRFDRYTDITLIGQGAMGVVYKAFDRELKRWVALKIPSDDSANTADVRRLRTEAESMARLTHHNIVRVFDVHESDGRTVISMELILGGSLEDHLGRVGQDQRLVARLMVAIARAVHHAHQRGILHRDLKPSNVLLERGEHGSEQPFVSDFGLAKRMASRGPASGLNGRRGAETTMYGRIIGTASYMSPEQARAEEATSLSDVYGLGGIMYALLTGSPPFRAESPAETLAQVRDPTRRPAPPHTVNVRTDRTLEAIALKCLRKDPTERYRSAEGLAKDLDRWLAHRPTEARPLNTIRRAGLWCRRNPLGASLVVALISLMGLAAADLASRLDEPRRIRRTVAEQTARLLQTRLDDMKQAVEATAHNPRLAELLVRRDVAALQSLIESEGRQHRDLTGTSPFETLLVVDSGTGAFVARWPSMDPASEGLDFRIRDYYKGLVSPKSPVAHVSQVFRSVTDQLFKFGVSAWVIHGENSVGAVVATVTTDARMGLADLESESFVTAVLALRDSNLMPGEIGTPPAGASRYVILLHPAYQQGIEPRWFPLDRLNDLRHSEVDQYEDPVANLGGEAARKYGGTWVASLAPVANSEFIVMVQQRASGAAAGIWILMLLVFVGLVLAAMFRYLRALPRRMWADDSLH